MIGFGLLLALIVGSAYGSLRAIGSLGSSLAFAIDVTAKRLDLADNLLSGVRAVRLASTQSEISLVNSTLLRHGKTDDGEELSCSACHTADNIALQEKLVAAAFANVSRVAATLRTMVADGGERAALARMEAGMARWQTLYGTYMGLAHERGFASAHDVVLVEIYPLMQEIERSAEAVHASEEQVLGVARRRAAEMVRAGLWQAGVVAGISVLIGSFVLLLIRLRPRFCADRPPRSPRWRPSSN